MICRIISRMAYDNMGMSYNTTRILTNEATFDAEAYYAYSPLYLPWAAVSAIFGLKTDKILSFYVVLLLLYHTDWVLPVLPQLSRIPSCISGGRYIGRFLEKGHLGNSQIYMLDWWGDTSRYQIIGIYSFFVSKLVTLPQWTDPIVTLITSEHVLVRHS